MCMVTRSWSGWVWLLLIQEWNTDRSCTSEYCKVLLIRSEQDDWNKTIQQHGRCATVFILGKMSVSFGSYSSYHWNCLGGSGSKGSFGFWQRQKACSSSENTNIHYTDILPCFISRAIFSGIWIESRKWHPYLLLRTTPTGMAEWIASLVRISLLPKLAIHCCLPSAACMRDVWKVSLLYTCSYSVQLYWWKR